jgi:ketohexokinase
MNEATTRRRDAAAQTMSSQPDSAGDKVPAPPEQSPRMPAAGTRGRVLGVGIATVDIVNLVAEYPAEDAEVRALAQRVLRGGNVTNTLAVLAQLGRDCEWVGTLADDAGGGMIRADLDRRGVRRGHAVSVVGACTPTSYITLSEATGSRTIVHHRALRELTAADFDAVPLGDCVWVHFEGRTPAETAAMIARVRRERPELPISVEIEKPRDGIERLFTGPDVLIFSRAYAESVAPERTVVDPCRRLSELAAASTAGLCLLPWGREGAYALAAGGEPMHAPAHPPSRLVDTLGAGDCFNATVIDGLLQGLSVPAMLARANRIAGHKCGQQGLDGLIASAGAAGLL